MTTDHIGNFDPRGLERYLAGHRWYTAEQVDAIIASCPKGLPDSPIEVQQVNPNGVGLVSQLVDRRTVLIKRLEIAAAWYIAMRTGSGKPSPSDLANKFKTIGSAAQTLLDALMLRAGEDPDGIPSAILVPLGRSAENLGKRSGGFTHHPPSNWTVDGNTHVDYRGDAELADAIRGVIFLRECAAEAQANEREQVDPGGGGSKGNEAAQGLVANLIGIWGDVFDQMVGTSVGKPGSTNAGRATGPLIRFIQACLKPLDISLTDEAVRDRVRRESSGKGKSERQKT